MRQRTINISLSSSSNNKGHILPVNKLLATQSLGQENSLFSAGRDGVIIQYSQTQPKESNSNSQGHKLVELHSDWVNDITLFGDKLVSASSDLSVQWWDPSAEEHGLIGHHHDYVKALSNYNNQYVVSGGLDKYVNFWDLNKSGVVISYENFKQGDKGSIYSLDSNSKIVAFGDNDYNILLFDPNSKKVVTQFGDHKDIVKSIVLNDSNYLLSGSSDQTVKIFDLRMNKVIKTHQFDHSIWCLQSNDQGSFDDFLAGDSYGSVFKVTRGEKQLVGQDTKGILSIAEKDGEILTSSMGNSNITNWSDPSKTIHNQSKGIIRKRMLNNRRNVVTLNESNEVIIWDILKCCEQHKFTEEDGKTFDEIAEEFQTKEILPNWCNVSITAGKLILTVSESNFTNTEIYGDELKSFYGDIEGIEDDIRYNLGKIFFMSIFQNFLKYLYGKDLDYRTEKINYLEEFNAKNTAGAKKESETKKPEEVAKDTKSKKFSLFSRRPSSKVPTLNQEGSTLSQETSHTIPTLVENKDGNTDETVTSLESVIQGFEKTYDTTYSLTSLKTSLISPPLTSEVPRLCISNYNFILNIKQKLTSETDSDEIDIFNDHLNEDNYEKLKKLLPKWVGNFILTNHLKHPIGAFSKIGFIVLRDPAETELPDINVAPQPSTESNTTDTTGANTGTSATGATITNTTAPSNSSTATDESKIPSPEPHDPSDANSDKSNQNKLSVSSGSSITFHKPSILTRTSSRSNSTSSSNALNFPTPPTTSGTSGASTTNNTTATKTTNTSTTPGSQSGSQSGSGSTSASALAPQQPLMRLNAYNMLRIKKIKSYIYEKFPESYKASLPDKFEPWLELCCNGEVVPDSMTLATLRTFVWKNSGDAVLHYRKKKETS